MADCGGQRAVVKLCFLLGKSTAETIIIFKIAYGAAKVEKYQLKANFVQK